MNEAWSVFSLKIPFKSKHTILTKNALFRPSPIWDVPLLQKSPFLPQHTHTRSSSLYLFRCPLLRTSVPVNASVPMAELNCLWIYFFPFSEVHPFHLFVFSSIRSKFKERQWEYSGERRKCGRLGYVSVTGCVCLVVYKLHLSTQRKNTFVSVGSVFTSPRWHGGRLCAVWWKGKMIDDSDFLSVFIKPNTVGVCVSVQTVYQSGCSCQQWKMILTKKKMSKVITNTHQMLSELKVLSDPSRVRHQCWLIVSNTSHIKCPLLLARS